MITLYGFGRVNDKVIGETRDLRMQIPTITDGDFELTESAAILLYLVKKSGKR